MSPAWIAVLGLCAFLCAGAALVTRQLYAGALAAAGLGVATAALLFASGFSGLGLAALTACWGVAAAGLIVGWTLGQAERSQKTAPRRGPWRLALAASGLLTAALGLGIGAVDWPVGAPGGLTLPAHPAASGALIALAAAAAVALSAFAPNDTESP